MAMWPFGKKNEKSAHDGDRLNESASAAPAEQPDGGASSTAGADLPEPAVADTPGDAAAAGTDAGAGERNSLHSAQSVAHDAINGATGPFDGDQVDIEDFDFSDFSVGVLDLGSIRIPLPKDSQVQVEMGEDGPKMLHVVTRHGRITPVAFAAPRSSGQWTEAAEDLVRGIERDGLVTHLEDGPWGSEVVGENENGTIRIIGVEGPRWMLRVTLAAPKGMEDDLAVLGREVVARSFVYRGDAPILAGNSLPVTMPSALADQVRSAMEERQQQAAEQKQAPRSESEDEAARQLRRLRDDNDPDSDEG